MGSLFQEHCQRWGRGCGAAICEGATKVFARGDIPCDVLFIGEAPGASEHALGEPFVGPAGHLLDSIIMQSGLSRGVDVTQMGDVWKKIRPRFTHALCNLVLCIPLGEDGRKTTEPDDDDIRKCQPRLEEFIKIANPRLIVAVGKLAADYLDQAYKHSVKLPRPIPVVEIVHPANILRDHVANQGLKIQRCIVTLQNALEEIEGGSR